MALRRVAYIPRIAPPIDAPVSEVARAHAALRRIDPRATATTSKRLGLDRKAVSTSRRRRTRSRAHPRGPEAATTQPAPSVARTPPPR